MFQLARLRRVLSRISIRLLAFNILLVFLPAIGIFYLDIYETKLLEAQERSMVQQGRLLAAALSERGELSAEDAERILIQLRQRTTARLRVLDRKGWLLADTSRLGPRREPEAETLLQEAGPEESWLYRLGSFAFRLYRRWFERPQPVVAPDFYSPERPFRGAEVQAALEGRYGAQTRITPGGQRSVTLYSALPIGTNGELAGAVLVSQSTLDLLQDLYDVRLAIFKVFLAAVAVAIVLSLLVSTTIARPLRRLREEASAILDRRGRLKGRFRRSQRRDEIGDLSRALAVLSHRLEEHVRFIESFAADVSHEFKNPLTSIRAATEMISEIEDPGEQRRFFDVVQAEIARMEHLLSTVREITLIDAQLDEEETAPVALNDLLAGLIKGFQPRSPNGVQLQLEVPEEKVVVQASPERLSQAVENLLDNAVSFSPAGSTVRIRLEGKDGTAVLRVSDQGPGIPQEHLERIFQRFFTYRPDDGKARRGHTGLGLAIVKAIVEGYGGSVAARSDPEGGATFEIRLPS